MAIEIFILSGARRGERLCFDVEHFSAGGTPGCDLLFDPFSDPAARDRAAQFRLESTGWYVRRTGSGEILVNQSPVQGAVRLRSGDVVRMSDRGPDFSFTIVARPTIGVPSMPAGAPSPAPMPGAAPVIPPLPTPVVPVAPVPTIPAGAIPVVNPWSSPAGTSVGAGAFGTPAANPWPASPVAPATPAAPAPGPWAPAMEIPAVAADAMGSAQQPAMMPVQPTAPQQPADVAAQPAPAAWSAPQTPGAPPTALLWAGFGVLLLVVAGLIGFLFAQRGGAAKSDVPPAAQRPELLPIADQAVQVGKSLHVVARLKNPTTAGDKLQFRLDGNAPEGASVDPASGEFYWTPSRGQRQGPQWITIYVTNSQGQADQVAFRATIERREPTVTKSSEPAPVSTATASVTPPSATPTKAQDGWDQVASRVKGAMLLLEIEQRDGSKAWPYGTCCAVRPNVVLTTASVACELVRFQAKKLKVFVADPSSKAKEEITEIRIHDGFFAFSAKPEEMRCYDVALLQVKGRLPKSVSVATTNELKELEDGLPLAAFGFTHDGNPITRHSQLDPQLTKGKVLAVNSPPPHLPDGPRSLDLIAAMPQNALGSPVLNAGGKVVAIYAETPEPGKSKGVKDLQFGTVVSSKLLDTWLDAHDTKLWKVPDADPEPEPPKQQPAKSSPARKKK